MQPLTETVGPIPAMSAENVGIREHSRDSTGPVTVIVPESGWVPLDLGELWRYRDLLWLLAWRDIAARYRQSVIGYGWAVLKPVLSMVIFTFIFNRVADIQSDGSPYQLFAFTGMLPWLYFSNTILASTASVVTSSGMLTKVYFPRMVLPVSSVVVGLVELAIQGVVLAALILYFNGTLVAAGPDSELVTWRFGLGWRTLCLPLFVALCVLSALAVGLWLTALNVKYRDVGQAVPFLVQAWMWLSPVVYPSSLVSPELRPYYGLNPMAGVIEGFRWSILGSTTPDWSMMGMSTAVVIVLLVTGLYYFRRIESSFADII
ncbi:MAG: ABC transporter permease [Planctomycetaceae bacterium]